MRFFLRACDWKAYTKIHHMSGADRLGVVLGQSGRVHLRTAHTPATRHFLTCFPGGVVHVGTAARSQRWKSQKRNLFWQF